MFNGLIDLPWWGYVLVGLVLVQITIAGVTLYLHRCQAHRALELHPVVSHFFRFWLWMTTGMITKEWAAIHRKHHAKCETEEDPHSPRIHGINKILWTGVVLYVKESHKTDVMDRYGHSTPDDWLERNIYTPGNKVGILILAALNIWLFGLVPGLLIYGVQLAWIPFWAAGVINGVGHWFGYRNFHTEDDSTNIVPWAAWIGGEELHNNHHAYPTSAKFSMRWYEFDLGWMYITILKSVGLASVRKQAPKVKLDPSKFEVDAATLQAVIAHRYDVLARHAKSMKLTTKAEIEALRRAGHDTSAAGLAKIRKWLHLDVDALPAGGLKQLELALEHSPALKTSWSMRQELTRIWERSTLNTEQLVSQLKDWCERAEKSGIEPLKDFSLRLRSYA
ncbi:MAG TPA: fatty acid desaturase [Usitatibacter sp.]|nr:fatty acid desaturase [Usitatibacter sp.]